ncbi:MAG: DUF1294 domain-containing protein [Phycisphaerales bacterium]|nr:DUF1294 domain-containing protein [Phycisphaerales bacterium]
MMAFLGSTWLAWLAIWMAVVSLAAFVAFGIDKRAARRQRRRIPERNLHLLELAGGWPGAILGAFVFRHKTDKLGYLFPLMLIVAAWMAAGWVVIAFTDTF